MGEGVGIRGLGGSVCGSVGAFEGTGDLVVIGTSVGAGVREGIGVADGMSVVVGWEVGSGVAFSGALVIQEVGNIVG